MTRGLNVVGYLGAASGLGEIARLLLTSLDAGGIPYAVVPESGLLAKGKRPFETSAICVNPDVLPGVLHRLGPELLDGSAVGFWWSEVEELPSRWRWAAALFDELWVGSEHVRSAVDAVVDKPVLIFPVPVVAPDTRQRSRAALGLPDGFLFLFSFNYESVFERKNPLGLVAAFSRAFPDRSDVALVVKTVNGNQCPAQRDSLRQAAAAHSNVYLSEDSLRPSDYHALYATCDAYVSLHRAEGFGLTIAEAMAHGKPAIATGYSGNLEFMRRDDSYLVPCSFTPIPSGLPYATGGRWAEPDLDEAARLMRRVVEHPDEARERGARARERLLGERTPARAGQFVEERLDALARAKRQPRSRLELVAERLLRGPNLYSTRPWLWRARKLATPFFRPYVDHHVEVGQLLLDALYAEKLELERKVAELEARVDLDRKR